MAQDPDLTHVAQDPDLTHVALDPDLTHMVLNQARGSGPRPDPHGSGPRPSGYDLHGSGSTLRLVDTKDAGNSPVPNCVSPLHQFSSLWGWGEMERRGMDKRQGGEREINSLPVIQNSYNLSSSE